MRADMHKVVVERPRWSPGPSKKGRRGNLSYELLPKGEGMKQCHSQRKGLTDLLGPLRRWLQSKVGERWNDVYSEACAVIKPDSVIRVHIKTHLLEMVERYTFMRDGRVWCISTRYQWEMPVEEAISRRTQFYVHPETGCLRKRPDIPKKKDIAHQPLEFYWLRSNVALRKAHGGWFHCFAEPFPEERQKPGRRGPVLRYDCAQQRKISRHETFRLYGGPIYFPKQRQLSSREMRELGLIDSSAGLDRISRMIVNFFRALQSRDTEFVISRCANQNPKTGGYMKTTHYEEGPFFRNDEQATQGFPV